MRHLGSTLPASWAPTLWIQVTFSPAFFLQLGTLRTIKQQQCRLLQSGADFSPPPGTKLITFLKRDFQTHLFVSNACFMCLFVCFKTYTATNTPSGLGSPSPVSHHCLKFLQEFYLKFQCIKITRLPPPPPAAPPLCPPLTSRHYRGGSEHKNIWYHSIHNSHP